MDSRTLHVVTGAFGYTGRFIARRLLEKGHAVRTLTGRRKRPDPFEGRVSSAPLAFDRPEELVENLRGAEVLYNTYWVRFAHGNVTFDTAVRNTAVLLRACEEAGLRRMVHISISNPSEGSPLPYFRGKAIVERMIRSSRLSYAILRPTVIFGPGDILINNIAWHLRRSPVFAVPGDGCYRLQPVFAADLAELAVDAAGREDNSIGDAAGPEIYAFEDLVRVIAQGIGRRVEIVHLAPAAVLVFLKAAGLLVRDVILTRDELTGLMAELLVTSGPPAGRTRFSDWLRENGGSLGLRYASELERHYWGAQD